MKIIKHGDNLVLFQEEIEGYTTNAALLLLPGKNFLVDTTALPEQVSVIWSFLEEHGREELPLWVVNTHHHWDHIWGNKAFVGCPIIAHVDCRRRMSLEGEEILRQFQTKNSSYVEVEIILPSLTFTDAMVLHEGGYTVEFCHFPSHTDDCILIYVQEDALLFAGDALETPFPMLEWEGGTKKYLKGLARLEQQPINAVIPGHGPVCGPELIAFNHHYIARVWETASHAAETGEPLEELFSLPLEAFLSPLQKAELRPSDFETHRRNLQRAYSDAVQERLERCKIGI